MAQNLDLNSLLPAALKNETLTSLVSNLFNRFLSQENSVFVNGRIGKQVAGDPVIQPANLDRELNALIPALYFKTGTEESIFTFEDFINRLNVLDVNVDNMREWIAEQTYNLSLPIDYDKFINYTNYYWVPAQTPGKGQPWNIEALPEFYVIKQPAYTSLTKMPVNLATSRNINLYFSDRPTETFTITFTSNLTFSVTSNLNADGTPATTAQPIIVTNLTTAGLMGALSNSTSGAQTTFQLSVNDPNNGLLQLCKFTIINGTSYFSAGDNFSLKITYFTSEIFISLNASNLIGKGTINGVQTVSGGMHIDGQVVKSGQRILVWKQNNPAENGIYRVLIGAKWVKTQDAAIPENFLPGSNVFVLSGNVYAGHTFQSVGTLGVDQHFTDLGTSLPIPVNEWQRYNNWVHRDDMPNYAQKGYTLGNSVQASRPIIEFLDTLEMNSAVDSQGNPTTGNNLKQVKTRFNQIPQFNLYRYDGTHAGITSGIFFFEEDPDFTTDAVLLKRVKTTTNSDFVFGTGLQDSQGRLLYYKDSGTLKSAWQPGFSTPTITSKQYSGAGNGTLFSTITTTPTSDNQEWAITAIDPITFSVTGTRAGYVGNAMVGTQFTCDDLVFTINGFTTPFSAGDTFTFSVQGPVSPRYVKKLADGTIANYPGGVNGDKADGIIDGAWMNPIRMFQNLQRETRTELNFGDALDHVRSVIKAQDGFIGTSYGDNNFRNLSFNSGVGGTIREFSSNFPLLASMLSELDVSPLTMMDFAEQQYNIALSSIDQFIQDKLPTYLATVGRVETSIINPNGADIQALSKYFQSLRGQDQNLNTVFSDSTAKVTNWPATLPMIGLLPATIPNIAYDLTLGLNVMTHHDGHIAPIAVRNPDLDRNLVKSIVTRSDGTQSSGIFSETQPAQPYARQLWMKPSTFSLSVFDVDFDSQIAPITASVGQVWYNRASNELRVWDTSDSWIPATFTVSSRWIPLDVSVVRNSLLWAIENDLYNSVHPFQQLNLNLMTTDVVNSQYAEVELAQFSAKYGYDTYAPDYIASDAFTWNYSQAVIPGLATTPARWYDIYTAYFDQPTINPSTGLPTSLSTPRPNIEPWRLMGYATKPATWDANYACTNPGNPANMILPVRVVCVGANITNLYGLQTIDGVSLVNGDRVLLTSQTLGQFNGVYIVSSGGWNRTTDTMSNQVTMVVNEGTQYAQSIWSLVTVDPVALGTTTLDFEQVRAWSNQMWAHIQAINPGMKLCVNTFNDSLLPPYVSASTYSSTNALLTTISAGISDSYVFGDNGPVESVWKKSLEYAYGLGRSYFRLKPLEFLDKSWGETYTTSGNNLRVERNLQASLPASKFLMHGERLNIINSYSSTEVQSRVVGVVPVASTAVQMTVTHVANNVTVFDVSVAGSTLPPFNYCLEQNTLPPSFTFAGVTFTGFAIKDFGIPYELGDTLIVSFDAAQNATYSFTPGTVKKFKGTGQWFTNLLRYSYIDTDVSTASQAYRGWELKLVNRVGSLIRPDSLSISTVQGVLPTTAYNVVLKRAVNTKSIWISGLRVQLVQMGTKTLGQNGLYVPYTDGSDWVFRVETYNPAHPQADYYELDYVTQSFTGSGNGSITAIAPKNDNQTITVTYSSSTNSFDVVSSIYGTSGTKAIIGLPYDDGNVAFTIVESSIPFANGDTFTLTVSQFQTFGVLKGEHTKLVWDRPTNKKSLKTTTTPLTITGIQNVVTFIYGYIDKLEADGWVVNGDDEPTTDALTGRNLNWQLEVEKFIDLVYTGMSAGDAYVLNPFMNKTHLMTPVGLMSRYTQSNFVDAYSTQAIYDVTGTVIPISNMTVVRTDEETITRSVTPIFSSHVFIDEFEHAILFNQKFSSATDAPIIFDPFLGLRIDSAYMSFNRQNATNGKPTFDGFFLNGNDVSRNITSSIDNIGNYYDADKTFSEQTTADHALALLGYQRKDYFTSINVSDNTQFNFWRGLIQAKGTNMTVNAFTNYKKFLDGSVDEYWAYKLAEYGDARERTFPEIKINASDVTSKFARLQFYSIDDTSYSALPLFTQIENSDDTRWFSIDDLGTGLKFEAQRITETVTVPAASSTSPVYVKLANIYHNGDEAAPTILPASGATIINANLLKATAPGTYTISGYTWMNPTKLSPIKLFDYKENTLVDEIGLWHPAIGIHAYSPLEVVNMITSEDPAHYNYTTQISNNPNYRHLKPWGQRETGRVWWDTSNLGYIPYHDATIFPNRETRHSRWGSMAEWASIDLYEWVESDYHPSAYNDAAALQEGDATIDASVRLSGTVGFNKYYSRNRSVYIRPIAWSQTGNANPAGHPSFGPDQTDVWVMGNVILADTGRTADIALTAGRSFGGWDIAGNKPVGEVTIGTVISFDIGSSSMPNAPSFTASGRLTDVNLSVLSGGIFGTRIGTITLTAIEDGTSSILRMSDGSGFTEDVSMTDWTTNDLVKSVKFTTFGLQVNATRNDTTSYAAANFTTDLAASITDVFIREGVQFTAVIPLSDTFYSNYPSAAVTANYGWKAWDIPAQSDLDADLITNNKWLPYLGDLVLIPTVSADIAKAMGDAASTLTLKSGIAIPRYTSTWSNWIPLTAITPAQTEQVSDGSAKVTFTLTTAIDSNRLSVYTNGLQLNPAGYVIAGNTVTTVNTLPEGNTVSLLYRAYQPTAKELAFDPSVAEDFTIQTQYKLDYQYTELEVRDANGNITGSKYYFWVKDKTIPQVNKNMSLVEAKQLLKSGEQMFTIFSQLNLLPTLNDPYAAAYDSCAVAGLNSTVTKNDSYKLRFLRDFTLRDDPEEMDLKNVHTEWTLIRQRQSSKIPANLWNALTNAVCGTDIGGNPLPSQVRIDYDARNGTRSRYGFNPGQIFAETSLVRASVTNTILNTQLVLNLGSTTIPDYITSLNMDQSDAWFKDAQTARVTMNLIWNTARASQINEIFFSVLDDALANNYEFTDLFKTSLITVNSSTLISQASQQEQVDELY